VLLVLGAAAASACEDPADATVASAEEVFVLEQSDAIQGRDGGGSGVVWDGWSVWAYGDTVLDVPDVEGETWHHNSFSMTEDLDASDGITGFEEPLDAVGAPGYFVAPTPEEADFNAAHRGDACQEPCGARWAVWPGEPVFDEARSRALVFYGLIYAEPGDFNFHGVGESIAIWSSLDEAPARPEVTPGAEHPTLLFSEGEPAYGLGATILDDALHSFACGGEGFDSPCTLARVPLDDALERDAWEYWDGDGWSGDLASAEPLFDGAPIMTVSFNAHLDRWTALYSDPGSNDVVLRTAAALTGPWSGELRLFTADRGTDEGWTYDANAHAEYEEDDGRVLYVSFSRPTGEGWFGAELGVVRVELE
jgi:hypothetical protein